MFSKYDVITEYEDSVIIYNILNKKSFSIPKNIYSKELFDNKSLLYDYLKSENFLSNNKRDFLENSDIYYTLSYQSSKLFLTLMMTMNCNFKCSYCFENDRRNTTIFSIKPDSFLTWLETFIKDYSITHLNLCFHGGEPLLCIDDIVYISEYIQKKFNNLDYTFSCVTNGYFLNDSNIKKLEKANVKKIQITLDGYKDIHDKRRILKNGSETFDIIVENIKKIPNSIKIAINVLFGLDTLNSAKKLLNYLHSQNFQSKLDYIVINYIKDKISMDFNSYQKEIAKTRLELIKLSLKLGFNMLFELDFNTCTLQTKNSFVILPSGEIYKCISLIENKKFRIGTINDDSVQTLYKKSALLRTDKAKCLQCKYSPICNKGCEFDKILFKHDCNFTYFEIFVPEYVKLLTKYKEQILI